MHPLKYQPIGWKKEHIVEKNYIRMAAAAQA